MKIEKREYKTYSFDELKPDAKEKATMELYDINVNYEWWEMYDTYERLAKKFGLCIDMKQASFDLDRENFVAFSVHSHGHPEHYIKGIYIDDYARFIKMAGITKPSKELKEHQFYIGTKHYAGGVFRNIIEGAEDLDEREFDLLEGTLDVFCGTLLKQLKEQYNDLTSIESIRGSIIANEYQFLEDGKVFTL